MNKNPYVLRWLQSTAPDKRGHVIDDFQSQLKSLQEHGVLDESVEKMFNQIVYCNPSVRIQPLQGNKKNRKRTNENHMKEGTKKRKTEQFNSSFAIIKEDKNKTRHNAEERKIKPNTNHDKLKENVKKKEIIKVDQNKSITEIIINKQGCEGKSKGKNDITKMAVKSRSTNEKVAFEKSNEINKKLKECSSSSNDDVHKIKTHSIIKHRSSESIDDNFNKRKKKRKKDEQENGSNYDNYIKKRDSRSLETSNLIRERGHSSNKEDIRKPNDLNKKLKGCRSNTSNNDFQTITNAIRRHVESSMEVSNQILEVGDGGTSKKFCNKNSNTINKKLKDCKNRIGNDNVQKTTDKVKIQGESKSIIKDQSSKPSEISNICKENIKKHQQENISHDNHTEVTDVQQKRTKEEHNHNHTKHYGCKKKIVDSSERQIKDKKIQSGTQIKSSKKKEEKTGRKKYHNEKANNPEEKNKHSIRNNNLKTKMSRQLQTADEPDYTRVTPSLTPSECNNIWADQGLAPPQLQAQTVLSGTKTTPSLCITEVAITMPPPRQPAPTKRVTVEAQCILNAPIEIIVGRMDQLPPITQLVSSLKQELDQASQYEESHCAEKQELNDLDEALLPFNGACASSDIFSANDESEEATLPANDLFESSVVISALTTELVPRIKTELVRNISPKNVRKTKLVPPDKQDLMRRNLLANDTKHVLHNLKPELNELDEALLPFNGVCESSAVISVPTTKLVPQIKTELVRKISEKNDRKTELVPLIKPGMPRNISLKNGENTELLPPDELDLMRRNLLANDTKKVLRNLNPDAVNNNVDAETPIFQLLTSLKQDILKKAKEEPLLPINSGSYFNLFITYNLYLDRPQTRSLTAVDNEPMSCLSCQ